MDSAKVDLEAALAKRAARTALWSPPRAVVKAMGLVAEADRHLLENDREAALAASRLRDAKDKAWRAQKRLSTLEAGRAEWGVKRGTTLQEVGKVSGTPGTPLAVFVPGLDLLGGDLKQRLEGVWEEVSNPQGNSYEHVSQTLGPGTSP